MRISALGRNLDAWGLSAPDLFPLVDAGARNTNVSSELIKSLPKLSATVRHKPATLGLREPLGCL